MSPDLTLTHSRVHCANLPPSSFPSAAPISFATPRDFNKPLTASFHFKPLRLIAFLAFCGMGAAHAATFACNPTAGTKSVSSGSTWVGGVAPNLAGGDTMTCATATVTVVIDTDMTIGTSPAAGIKVITFTGGATLALGHNVTLTALGGIQASILQVAAGSHIRFDSSAAANPTSTPYTLTANTFIDDALFPPLNTVGNIWTIDYNTLGTPFRWAVATPGSGVTGLHNFNWTGCGSSDNSAQCLLYAGGGSGIVSIGPGVFDTTCGIKWIASGYSSNDGINLTGVTFKNTYSACAPVYYDSANNPNAGVPRSMNGMVFDGPPRIQMPAGTVSGVLYGGISGGVAPASQPGTMTHSFYRNSGSPNPGNELGNMNWDHSTIIQDGLTTYSNGKVHSPIPFRAGTVTSCTSSTATDSTASFPSTMIDNGTVLSSGYVWVLTTGADAGIVSNIKTATPSTVTLFENLRTPCSPGDHYVVYQAQANPHFMTINPNIGTWTGSHLIGWFYGGDFNGDFIHGAGANNRTYNISYVTVLPNVAKNNSGTATTLGGSATSTPRYNIDHFTYFVGSQSASACEGCGTSPSGFSGSIKSWLNNIAYSDPTVVYPGVKATQATLGPYKLQTSQGLPSIYVADIVATNCDFGFGAESCANFNFGYGTVPGSATAAPNGYSFVLHGGNKGYNINSSVPMGTHDVDGIDPGFADRYADPLKWGQSLGIDVGQIDPFQILADVLNCMMSVNDPGGYSPATCSPDSFYNYVGKAMAPHNVAYHNSGSDGGDVGAWPYAPPPVTPVSISVVPGSFNLMVGGTQALVCITKLSDNTTRACINPIFSSSNNASATVYGPLVTATAMPGSGLILVAAEGFGQAAAFTVVPPPTPVSIALIPTVVNLWTGATQSMTCVTTLSDSTSRICISPIFSSTNTASATVSGSLVTATATPGDGMITVAAEGLTQVAAFTVTAPPAPTSIALVPGFIDLLTGATQTISCVTTLSDNSTRACLGPQLASTDPSYATVAGLVVSATSAPGTGNITVTAESFTASVGFRVTVPVPTPVSISLSPNPVNLLTGATQTIICTTTMSDNTTRACINPVLASSDATLATVAGLVVTATNAAGTGTLTATAESLASPADAFTVRMYPNTSVACSAMSTGLNGALNGFIPSPNDAWHQDITTSAIDPNSATIVNAGTDLGGAYLTPGFSSIANSNNGIPYTVVDSQNMAATAVPITLYPDQSDVAAIPLPATLPVEGSPGECPTDTNGRHAIVVDRNQCVAYELFQAAHCTSGWMASASSIWDLTTTEARPWTDTSADSAGLSVFEGLLRYDEIIAGVVDHAIRFTARATRSDGSIGYFTPPATHAAGNDPGSDNIMGMRIRLQPDFDISGFSPTNQIILKAMKQYGMILADNGPTLAFQGTPDARWNDADLAALTAVPATAFDVIQMGTVYESTTVPTGAPPTINSFTPSASTILAGASVTLTPTLTDASYSYVDQTGFDRGPITVTPTVTTTYALTSRNAFGSATASTTVTVQQPTIPPTLHVNSVPNQTFGVAPFSISATSNSPGAISYSIGSGPAAIVGNVVTLTGTGTVVVNVAQAASGNFGTATGSTTFTVSPGNPALAFATITTPSFGTPLPLSVTTYSSGSILYSLLSGPATLSGNVLTFSGLGKVVLRANQAATSNYTAAVANTTLTVTAGVPTLTIAPIADQTFGSPPITLSATSTSPAPIVYAVTAGYASLTGNTLTLLQKGPITVRAKQAAAGNYATAAVTTSFNVLPEPPNLTIATIPNKVFGTSVPFSVSSTSMSAVAVVYSVVSGPAKVSGHTVTLTGVGHVILQASQLASGNYAAATATTSFTVN